MRRLLHLTLFVLFLPLLSSAADRYWVGNVFPPGVSDWNNTANWSATQGGAGGASVPGAADVANFRSTNANNTGYFLFFANDITVQAIRVTKQAPGNQNPNITFGGNVVLTGATQGSNVESLNVNYGTVNFSSNLTIQADVNMTNGATVNVSGTTTFNNNTNNNSSTVSASGAGGFFMTDAVVNKGTADLVFRGVNSAQTSQYVVNGNLSLQSGAVTSIASGGTPGEVKLGGNLTSTAGFRASNASLQFIGSANQTVTMAAGTEAIWDGNIIFNVEPNPVDVDGNPIPVATINLNSPFIANAAGQTVTFTSGIVNSTTTNYLGFGAGVVANGANNLSYVDGYVRKTGTEAFTFPTGDAGFYAPVHISGNTAFTDAMGVNPGTGLPPTYQATYLRENPQVPFPNNAPQPTDGNTIPTVLTISIQEYFIVDFVSDVPGFPPSDYPTGATPYTWFSYENLRSGGLTQPSSVIPVAWLTNRWSNLGPSVPPFTDGAGNTYIRSGIRSFSVADNNPVFTLATNNPTLNPLPVEWLDFTGRRSGSVVELAWATTSEKNNEKFNVERSADGVTFTTIGSVAGNGSTNLTSNYAFTDKSPLSSIAVYRIKQIDENGKFSYSKQIRVAGLDGNLLGIKLYPNPAPTSAALYLENPTWRNQRVKVTIINAIGAVVRTEEVSFHGDTRTKINISGIQRGAYYLSTQVNGEKNVVPFVIQ